MKFVKKTTRQKIIEENLLSLKNNISFSDRNINIVEDYVGGMSLRKVGDKYHISSERVRGIVVKYIIHCHWYIRDNKRK